MADESKRTPPYVSYRTFKSTVMGLEHVPDTIDYSLFQSMNGSTRTLLFGAFKFFELIDAQGTPSERFAAMVTKDETVWKTNMAALVRHFYGPQLKALSNGTVAGLKSSFGDIGASVVGPATRFLIAAAKDVEIPVSPTIASAVIGAATPRTKRRPKVTPRAGGDGSGGNGEGAGRDDPEDNRDTIGFPVPFSGKPAGRIVVPQNFDESDLPLFNAMVAGVVAFAKQNGKGSST